MKQVVRLERYSDKAEAYDGVCIDYYVDISTLKCKELRTGDILIPYCYTVSGSPKFPSGTYEKYANGEKYATIEVECLFEEKELDLDRSTYDTLEGITSYVKDLDTLHNVLNCRYIAGYKKKIRLNEHRLFNKKIYLDSCGNVGIMIEDNYISSHSSYNMSNSLPKSTDVCPCCGKGWNLSNMFDSFENSNYEIFHKNCNLINNLNIEKRKLINAIKDIYPITELDITAVPNEYSDYQGYATWFIFHTTDGDIKIGWRKRVINIKWLDNYKQFGEIFATEDVTKGDRYIHAWGYAKLTEYIKMAKESIF